MVFSSITFIYYFLPIILLIYFILPSKMRNYILLIGSLLFYFYGEPRYILVLLFSCIFNYYLGKYIEKHNKLKKSKYALIFGLIINFGILFYFKYFNFFITNLNTLFNLSINLLNIIMPIGISFFTFQATSYLIDLKKGKVKSSQNVFTFATYLTLFPQLIAGPIVRYETVEKELRERKTTFKTFYQGIQRFIVGLSKKVLIANILGELSLSIGKIPSVSILSSWTKAIADTFQIYFDFSGYSDMAIGLGLMFGFHFLENFNYPFISTSITDFWRRWHISLSSWFKDYIYIPLGGNRNGKVRQYFNILVVWLATGLWHGASWNFVLWGLYFAILLIIEKLFFYKIFQKRKVLGFLTTAILIIISFVIFNQTSIFGITNDLKNMFGLNNIPFINKEIMYYLKNYLVILLIAVVGSTPIIRIIKNKLDKNNKLNKLFVIIEPLTYILLLLICTAFIIDESFNPFLYFRF